MFGFSKNKQIGILLEEIQYLKDKVEKLENKGPETIRIGNYQPFNYFPFLIADTRPSITHAEAIAKIMEHVGIEFKEIPGTKSKIVVEQKLVKKNGSKNK